MQTKKTLASTMESKSAIVDRILDDVDNKLMAYEELRLIREKLVTTGISDELYSFLDKNSDMSQLFAFLPKHDGSCSLESDQTINEVHCVDLAMEGLLASIKQSLINLWKAFWNWVLDWIDDNRRLHFRLQRHSVALENNSLTYGDDSQLSKLKAICYHYNNEWKVMLAAVNDISDLLKQVPSNDVEGYLKKKAALFNANLKIFGAELTDATVTDDSTPTYSKQERIVGKGGANWTCANMLTGCKSAMEMLKLEEAKRSEFNNIRRAFDQAVAGDGDSIRIAQMSKLIRVCKFNKRFASTVARACADVCKVAKANASK